jgi:hypothetical protein
MAQNCTTVPWVYSQINFRMESKEIIITLLL